MNKIVFPILISQLFSLAGHAMGLGEMKVNSYLNQPFDAEVQLLDVGDIPISGIRAELASPEEFEQMGFERANILNLLNFNIEQNSAGKTVVHVKSSERITEPYLEVMIDLAWARGQVYRYYNILLDPPAYKLVTQKKQIPVTQHHFSNEPGVIEKPVFNESKQTSVAIESISGVNTYGPTRSNETVWQIAQRYRSEDVLLQQMILAIVGTNPDAFSEGNLNGLKENMNLAIPDNALAKTVPVEQAKMEVFAHDSAWQSKQPIEHILMPPYIIPINLYEGDSPLGYPLNISKLPTVPFFTKSLSGIQNDISYLPRTNPVISVDEKNNQANTQSVEQAKLKAQMDLAISAIASVRDANNVLKDQLVVLQGENKRLREEIQTRDQQMKQLQQEMLLIKNRQSVAGQASRQPDETKSNLWLWFLILGLLAVGGAGAYWWFWMRSNDEGKVEPLKEPLVPSVPPKEESLISDSPIQDEPIMVGPSTQESMDIVPPPQEFPVVVSPLVPEPLELNEAQEAEQSDEDSHLMEFETSEPFKPEVPEKTELTLADTPDPIYPETTEEAIPERVIPVKSLKALDILLDLAKTYMSMGDKEAAEQSLEEVLLHGNKEQQTEAQSLLAKLKS